MSKLLSVTTALHGHKIDSICPKQLTDTDYHFVFFTG